MAIMSKMLNTSLRLALLGFTFPSALAASSYVDNETWETMPALEIGSTTSSGNTFYTINFCTVTHKTECSTSMSTENAASAGHSASSGSATSTTTVTTTVTATSGTDTSGGMSSLSETGDGNMSSSVTGLSAYPTPTGGYGNGGSTSDDGYGNGSATDVSGMTDSETGVATDEQPVTATSMESGHNMHTMTGTATSMESGHHAHSMSGSPSATSTNGAAIVADTIPAAAMGAMGVAAAAIFIL